MGFVVQVNLSPGGLPKRPVPEAYLTPLGFEGDSHSNPRVHGGPRKAVLLVPSETTDELIARGLPLFYGALGENLTTRGLDRTQLREGMRLRCGEAVIELTQLRKPCGNLDVYGPELRRMLEQEPSLGGFYASVVQTGRVRAGDPIEIESVAV